MFVHELREFLAPFPHTTNVLIFTTQTEVPRQLLVSDISKNHDGNIVINAEYNVPVKSIDLGGE